MDNFNLVAIFPCTDDGLAEVNHSHYFKYKNGSYNLRDIAKRKLQP